MKEALEIENVLTEGMKNAYLINYFMKDKLTSKKMTKKI